MTTGSLTRHVAITIDHVDTNQLNDPKQPRIAIKYFCPELNMVEFTEPTQIPRAEFSRLGLQQGGKHLLCLKQGRLKAGKDGSVPFHYYWDYVSEGDPNKAVAETMAAAAADAADAPAAAPRGFSMLNAAEGAARGNGNGTITAGIAAYVRHHGELPTRDWVVAYADLVNIGSDRIVAGRQATPSPGQEEPIEADDLPFDNATMDAGPPQSN